MPNQAHRREGERRSRTDRRKGNDSMINSFAYDGPERRNSDRRSSLERRH